MEVIERRIVEIDKSSPWDLDHVLCKFFIEVCKVNGKQYKLDTFSGIQTSIQRQLSRAWSESKEFEKSRKNWPSNFEKEIL